MVENLPSARPAPGIDDDDAARAQRLKDEGLKVPEIAEALGVSVRQIYRLLVIAREQVRPGDSQAWTLSSSIEDGEQPEAARYLLETNETVLWRRGTARYAWAVYQAKPLLPPALVSAFADMLANLSWRSGRDREIWGRILDFALVSEPWVNEENEVRFFKNLYARDVADLEYAAQVSVYLKGIAENWRGLLRVEGPVPDQVDWLRKRVEAIKREEEGEPGTIRLLRTPGDEDA